MTDSVNIVGAGPAGLTAAIVLRRRGVPVRVYDISPDVGMRLNGDFQGFENWSENAGVRELFQEIGIETNFLLAPYFSGTVSAPSLSPITITSRKPIFYLVRRGPFPGTLDSGLKEQALALGAELLFNRRLDAIEGKTIVGTGPRGVDVLAAGLTFTTGMEDAAQVLFDDSIAPKGYAYLLVHGGRGTMATVMYRDFHREKECFAGMLRYFSGMQGLDMANERRFASYGNFFMRDSQVDGDILYVGEAAGFQDSLWGFGMRYAVLSGYLAARSIIEGSDYDLLWKERIKPMMETSLVNRYILEKLGGAGYRYLARKFAAGKPCDYLQGHYNSSIFKRMLLPLAKRWYAGRALGASIGFAGNGGRAGIAVEKFPVKV